MDRSEGIVGEGIPGKDAAQRPRPQSRASVPAAQSIGGSAIVPRHDVHAYTTAPTRPAPDAL
ncbi:hypothetical protein TRAPUB_8529 [Trametes pubescens]|uniref:Uncharacterized protein n=1 Tax=Trametes pubescens TaxID=154538 RepID=A0A1M2W513_TRAPU|nr:hypothetical protein TRAPUB_8529 [Trametes pubescens]